MTRLLRSFITAAALSSSVVTTFGQTGFCIEEAEREYEAGQISQAITSLRPCWQKLGEKVDRLQALRLLALLYLEDGQPDSARQHVKSLLEIDRRYRTDRNNDPVYFRTMVDELRPPPWYMKKWVWAVGGVAVGGVVSYFVFRPGPEPLPSPEGLWPPP